MKGLMIRERAGAVNPEDLVAALYLVTVVVEIGTALIQGLRLWHYEQTADGTAENWAICVRTERVGNYAVRKEGCVALSAAVADYEDTVCCG